ncbi:UNKNOWN [Stylonychia lemnae]|uniref:Uncharacterized protein n=1 Tax=Stylonychia lemnae TaxID=5949 RepID=A0A078AVJ6_STYLE|nr:UNKNOWN [Stylonychia lemnae]|eukprot:CDW86091.1 UNKNOWN [Stylonychia lemnae]
MKRPSSAIRPPIKETVVKQKTVKISESNYSTKQSKDENTKIQPKQMQPVKSSIALKNINQDLKSDLRVQKTEKLTQKYSQKAIPKATNANQENKVVNQQQQSTPQDIQDRAKVISDPQKKLKMVENSIEEDVRIFKNQRSKLIQWYFSNLKLQQSYEVQSKQARVIFFAQQSLLIGGDIRQIYAVLLTSVGKL